MAVCREDIENALAIAIEDEAAGDANIKDYELINIKKRFDGLLDQLIAEAEQDEGDE